MTKSVKGLPASPSAANRQLQIAFGKNYGQNLPKPMVGQHWAFLSQAMFDQIAFEESQKREPPFTLAQPISLFQWCDQNGKTEERTSSLRRNRKCRGCQQVLSNGNEPRDWIFHEDSCDGLKALAVRTIERLIEMNDKLVPEIVTRYPVEMNWAANNLLTKLQGVEALKAFANETDPEVVAEIRKGNSK